MKKLLLFALALCSASAHALAQSPPAPATPDGMPKVTVTSKESPAAVRVTPALFIPDEIFNRELKDLDGRSFHLSNYRGRVFVLNFWASWCGPCRLEVPQLNKLNEEFGARGVEVVGLTTENPQYDEEKVRDFAREFGMKYRAGWADAETARALMNGTALPQTLVIGTDGRVVLRIRGYSPDKAPQMLRDGIEKALNPPPAADPAPAVQTSPATPAPSKPAAPAANARP